MNFKIPLFSLNYDEREEKAVIETLRSKWISMGPKTIELESEFSKQFKVQHSIALSNCTVALHLALCVLGINEGDEVIVPSLTFVATVNAIRYLKAKPVFCDVVGNDDLTIDPRHLKALITSKTKAVIPMHFAGFPCDMDQIMKIAIEAKIKVVEDACHAPLSEYKGKKLGAIGDIGCFSFFSNKNIGTGEGGMCITNNDDYAAKLKLLRSHGMTTLSYERSKGHSVAYDVIDLGYNYRIDDIRASLALVQLEKLASDISARKMIRKKYEDLLGNVSEITIPFLGNSGYVSNYIFPVILNTSIKERRDQIRNKLHEAGIQTSVHYPAVHRFSIYQSAEVTLPKTEYIADNEITLPMYGNLKNEEIEFICKKLIEFVKWS